jgi:hypothetical protein
VALIPGLSIEFLPPAGPAFPERPVARWALNDGLELRGFRGGGHSWLELPGVATFRFDGEGAAVAFADGGSQEEIADAWVRSVLPLVVQARGVQVLHASAVAAPGGVIGFCGASAAGKSTLAAALLCCGYEVVADDALAFRAGADEVEALPLPYRLRLRGGAAEALGLPELAARGEGGGSFPLAGIVELEPAAVTSPQVSTLAAADGFGTLMPHAYCFELDDAKEDLVDSYLRLARSVPVCRLEYPQRLDRLDDLVAAVKEML